MYESFYGFREKPFSLLPDPEFLYLGETHSTALTMLETGLMNLAGITVITGEIGCGKTTLIRYLLSKMEQDTTVGLISNTHRSFGELMPCSIPESRRDGYVSARDQITRHTIEVEFDTAFHATFHSGMSGRTVRLRFERRPQRKSSGAP